MSLNRDRLNHQKDSKHKSHLKLWSFPLALVLASTNAIVSAQIVPDNTLPQNSLVAPNGDIIEITGGTVRGNNLFHSFEQFSLLNQQTAFFNNAVTIDNIISRVTGSSISEIDGLIRSLGTANLFLLNPNGIIFGDNASLDIGGSFIGSTANSLKFTDGSEFSATTPDALLTVSIPIGLQYGSSSGSIAVKDIGNNLVLNRDFSINSNNRPDGLKVADGKTLALVGGEIDILGGNLTAAEGNIELWAVKDGLVSLVNNDRQLQIEARRDLTYGNIELSQAASINASGNSGGAILLQGQNISITDGSVLLIDTLGTGSGGNVDLRATELVKIQGISALSPIFSGIFADVAPGATGNGGDVSITAKSLQVTDGGQVSSGTFGIGDAGSLTVQTQDIQISGGSPFGPSGLFTPVALGATGNGGNLTVETGSLMITDAAQITSTTFGFGNSGNLTIKADEIDVSGGNEFAPSSITATVFKIPSIPPDVAPLLGAGLGNGGNLTIETNSLRVADGGQISVSTSGSGTAGNLTVEAKNVELLGWNDLGRSGLFANTIVDSGDGGNINLDSDRISIKDGATISVGNFASNLNIPPGTGKAGNITINANSLQLESINPEALSKITASTNSQAGGNITLNVASDLSLEGGSQIASETRGIGDGGSITIAADGFNLSNRGEVSVNSRGLGQAGNIDLTVSDLNSDGGKITATSSAAGGGDIRLTTDFIYLQNNSEISTSVFDGTGGGGNITIESNYVIASDNSDLRANAFKGDGGNIDIATEVILLSLDSEIDASSQFGFDGVVEIDNLDTNEQIGLSELPEKIIDPTALITALCSTENSETLVTTGKGGLAENPRQNLRGESVWEDLRAYGEAPIDPEIVEAKAWNINERGKVELLSYIPQPNQRDYWTLFNRCH